MRAQVGISVGILGAVLLAMGAAALITAPLVPRALRHLGPGRTLGGAIGSISAGLALVGIAHGVPLLVAGFLLLGAGQGLLDVAASATGIELERILETPRLSAWHGWYQFALLGGAILAAAAAGSAVSVSAYFAVSAAIVLVFGARASWNLRHAHPVVEHRAPTTRASLRRIAVMSMLALYAESAATGWAVVFVKSELGATSAVAALGFAVLPLTLGLSRVSGERAALRIGSQAVLVAGSMVAGGGLVWSVSGCSRQLGVR